MTKVYMHPYHDAMKDAMMKNPEIYDYWHVTGWYFHPKPPWKDAQGNPVEQVVYDHRTFRQNMLVNGRYFYETNWEDSLGRKKHDERWNDIDGTKGGPTGTTRRFMKDMNHPWMYRNVILDMERHRVEHVNHPDRERMLEEYRGICRSWKASGHPSGVAVYGIGAGARLFQGCWHKRKYEQYLKDPAKWGQEGREKYNTLKLKEYTEKEAKALHDYEDTCKYFIDELDAMVVSLYMPYYIPDMDSWQWESWMYYVNTYIDAAREYSSGKPVYVFVQPNYVAGIPKYRWEPIQRKVWDAWINYLLDDKCDRVYVFALKEGEVVQGKVIRHPEGWTDVFMPEKK